MSEGFRVSLVLAFTVQRLSTSLPLLTNRSGNLDVHPETSQATDTPGSPKFEAIYAFYDTQRDDLLDLQIQRQGQPSF